MKKGRKKIFLGWSGHQRYPAKAIELFRERGYDTVYWICTDDEGIRIPGITFHEKVNAERCIPAEGVDASAFPPPEAEMIRSLYKVESMALTLMNSFATSVDEKKRLYHEHLRYWKGILELYKPDYLVFSCYPHPLAFYILSEVGRMMGIPTVFIHDTNTVHRLLWNHDHEKSPPMLLERLKENRGKKISVHDLPEDLRKFYEKHRARKDATPEYMPRLAHAFSVSERMRYDAGIVWRSLKDGSFFVRIYNLLGHLSEYSVEDELKQLITEPDLSKPFVYVPLHLQPEAQSFLEDAYADQTLMLETLSYALPEGWLLYVKENPYQFPNSKRTGWSPTRYPGYYKKIVALGNTRIVPLRFDTFKLIEHSKAVATITGTASLEAVFRDKPTMTFGYPWFGDIDGLIRVQGPESVRKAFARIQQGYRPDQDRLLAFLKSLDEASVCGTVDRSTPDEEGYTHEETTQRFVDFLSDEMDTTLAKRS